MCFSLKFFEFFNLPLLLSLSAMLLSLQKGIARMGKNYRTACLTCAILNERECDRGMSEELLQQLIKMVAENNRETKEMRQEIGVLGQRMERLEQRLDRVEHRLDRVEHRLDGLEKEVESLRSEMHVRFDKVDRHFRLLESDIDLLVAKTAEHERELNRLKVN